MVGSDNDDPIAPPDDTGEALGLGAAAAHGHVRLRPGAVRARRRDRFGLADRKPGGAAPIPPLPGRRARPGDQRRRPRACRRAPTTPRSPSTRSATWPGSAAGRGRMRWSQLGFGRTSTTDRTQATPRNLMGFKDGTNNIRAEDTDAMRRYVWVGRRGRPGWMRGRHLPGDPPDPDAARDLGPLHARRPGADDRARRRLAARRSGEQDEHDAVDLAATQDGDPVIPVDAHIRLAAPRTNDGEQHPAPRLLVHRRHRSRSSASSTPACSSSASSATRCASSSPSSGGSAPPTRSTSTSVTPAARSSRSRPALRPGGFVGEGLFA